MEPWGGHKVWRLRRLDLWGVSWFNCFHYHVPGAALIWAQTLSPAVQIFLFELLYREPSLPVLSLAFSQCNRCSGWVKGQWASGWVSAVGMQKFACLSASRISAGKPSQPFPVTVSVHLFIQTECIDSQMQTRHGKESQHQRCPGNYLITHTIYIYLNVHVSEQSIGQGVELVRYYSWTPLLHKPSRGAVQFCAFTLWIH